jgi:hypothetical protein
MSKWGKTAYPFETEVNTGRSDIYKEMLLRSDDGWIEYELRRDGWYVIKNQVDDRRTVIQVARDSENPEVVIEMTENALSEPDPQWFAAEHFSKVVREYVIAVRAKRHNKI